MEEKNAEENRAYLEMLRVAAGRLKGRYGEEIAARSGAVFHSQENKLELKSFHEKIELQLPDCSTQPKMEEWHQVWFADEEFPASGKLFLQGHADHYLSVEDAVTAGGIVIEKLSEFLC